MKKIYKMQAVLLAACVFTGLAGCGREKSNIMTITNVSYDATREFYESYNEIFKSYYEEKYGEPVNVIQSHAGSGSQARSVVEGCNADVVTLALENDISLIEKTFLVRKGNEKNIKDWDDLIKDGVEVITPDPKSSGGACWNFLAALSYAREKYTDTDKQNEFIKKLYANVSVLDSGARGSATTFVENQKGDVLIAWENEAMMTVANYPGQYEIVTPSVSILAQPSVAVVDDNVKVNKSGQAAGEYLSYLYSENAQRLVADYGYRPSDEKILNEYSDKFNLNVKCTTINDFGGWDNAYKQYFDDGALFDKLCN